MLIAPDTAGIANGHDDEHEGPIWNPTLKADGIEWGDIIPPYTYQGVDYEGQNWTPEGQLIYANECEPSEGLSAPAVPAIDLAETCDGGQRPTPLDAAGVTYEFTVGDGVTGPWEITATPLPGFDFADGVQSVFTGDAGDSSVCLAPAVLVNETCDSADAPDPVETEGIVYEFTEGDGTSGPWEITASAEAGYFLTDDAQTVFTGDAGDPASCVTPPPGEEGDDTEAVVTPAREDGVLPDTGGLPLWMLIVTGPMTVAGVLMIMRRRPVVHAFTSGGGPAYSLSLPPARHVVSQPTSVPARGRLARLIAAARSVLGGGQR